MMHGCDVNLETQKICIFEDIQTFNVGQGGGETGGVNSPPSLHSCCYMVFWYHKISQRLQTFSPVFSLHPPWELNTDNNDVPSSFFTPSL